MENKKVTYYTYYNHNGNAGTLVKFIGNDPYVYENGEWKFDAHFVKILMNVTDDAVEISEEETNKIIKARS